MFMFANIEDLFSICTEKENYCFKQFKKITSIAYGFNPNDGLNSMDVINKKLHPY